MYSAPRLRSLVRCSKQRARDLGVNLLLMFSRLFTLQALVLTPGPAQHCHGGPSPFAQLVRYTPRQDRGGNPTVPKVSAES